MHEPVKKHLEELLEESKSGSLPAESRAHLDACNHCRAEVNRLASQACLVRSLRSDAGLEPGPGFYARVLNRIETDGPESFWSVFLQPVFGTRLSIACATVVLVLGGYLASTELQLHSGAPDATVSRPALVAGVPGDDEVRPQDRDAMLIHLVSFRE